MTEGWRMGENGSESTIRGRLTREVVDAGSKSERSAPVLEEADGQRTRVYVIGDNPYENGSLSGIEGQEVTARGRWRTPGLGAGHRRRSARLELPRRAAERNLDGPGCALGRARSLGIVPFR